MLQDGCQHNSCAGTRPEASLTHYAPIYETLKMNLTRIQNPLTYKLKHVRLLASSLKMHICETNSTNICLKTFPELYLTNSYPHFIKKVHLWQIADLQTFAQKKSYGQRKPQAK